MNLKAACRATANLVARGRLMSKCPLDKMMDCHKHHTQTDVEPCGERDWLTVSLCPNLTLFGVITRTRGREQCRICRARLLWLNGSLCFSIWLRGWNADVMNSRSKPLKTISNSTFSGFCGDLVGPTKAW